MCGIVGYVGRDEALPIVLEGLRRLEYRGYDSAGVALLDGELAFEVLGVTGHITLSARGAIDRRPLAATFRDGRCVVLE